MIRITIQPNRIPEQLKRISAAVQSGWWDRYAPVATGLLEREQDRHFQAQAGPNGETWAPFSPLTLAISQGQAALKVGGQGNARLSKSGKRVTAINKALGSQQSATIRRTSGSQLLMGDGILRASVTSGGAGAIRETGQNYLLLGTNLIYAKTQHKGADITVTPAMRGYLSAVLGSWFLGQKIHIPARPFLGTGDAVKKELVVAAKDSLDKAVRDAAR